MMCLRRQTGLAVREQPSALAAGLLGQATDGLGERGPAQRAPSGSCDNQQSALR